MPDNVKAILIVGATGDLAQRMLLPSLYGLDADALLDRDLRIIAAARRPLDESEFRRDVSEALKRHLNPALHCKETLGRFLARLKYVPVDVTSPESFMALKSVVGEDRGRLATVLSTAPELFEAAILGLHASGLAGEGASLALEKPLGHDAISSRAINDTVASYFPEERTFRIDHYLGKETVQNLLALRFGNVLFEPLWNSAAIDHVQITVAETVGLEGRSEFYNGTGALRDMVQNHMLQLLALVAMEPPWRFDATAVRDEKVKVLRALRRIDRASAQSHSVIGQYGAGAVDGIAVPGFEEELGEASRTETFVALKAHVDNWRWRNVPFYLRTGKRMQTRRSEIFIQFKDAPHSIFAHQGGAELPNKLQILLQPEENIRLRVMAKRPGLDRDGLRLREVPLDLGRDDVFADTRRRIAYERLLRDLLAGDTTLFVRRDEVAAQWDWIDSIRDAWAANGMAPKIYTAGTWGPASAMALPERYGASWHD